MAYDTLIVGAGFAGSVMARQLAEAGQRVLVIDKRDHIGGNAYDYVNDHGVRIHKYGPHIFHTNSDKVFEYLSRFTEWRPYEHRVLASVDGMLVPFPINLTTLQMLYGRMFSPETAREFLANRAARDWHGGEVRTAEDQIVSQVGRELFELFFAGYTRKMWGREAKELDKSVTARIPIRFDRDDRYFTDKHQAMPKDGYTALFERMLDHPGIEVRLSSDQDSVPPFSIPKMVWTGPIDEVFGHRFGPLPYRSLRFETTLTSTNACGAATINQPAANTPWTRATQWALLAGSSETMTPETNEYPTAEGEPYYPIPCPEARALYKRYGALAAKETNVTFLGRLGRYQYLNMDQAIGQALAVSERLLSANPAR